MVGHLPQRCSQGSHNSPDKMVTDGAPEDLSPRSALVIQHGDSSAAIGCRMIAQRHRKVTESKGKSN